MLVFQLAKVVGTPSDQSWSQVHSFRPEEEEKLSSRGHLLAVLSLSGAGEGVTAVETGREAISRLHEEYYGELERQPLAAIEAATEKVAAEVSDDTAVEIVAAALIGSALYLAAVGKSQAALMRQLKMGKLLVGQDEVTSASGYLEAGDLLLLGSSKFFNLVGEGALRAALEAGSPQEVVEALAPLIHGKEKSGDAAAVVAQAGQEAEEEVAKIETEAVGPEKSEKLVAPTPEAKVSAKARLPQVSRLGQTLVAGLTGLLARTGPIYARRGQERSRRSLATVALILALLLSVSIFLGLRGRGGPSSQIAAVFDEASQKYQEAEALSELNPARARALLAQAKEALEAARVQAPTREVERINKLLAEIDAIYKVVAREFQIDEAKVFYEINLIYEGARGEDLAFDQGTLLVLDREGNRLFAINAESRSAEVLSGAERLGQTRHAALYGSKSYVLGTQGIVEVDNQTKDARVVVEADSNWGEIADVWAYAANLYLLDKGNGQIWKYNRTETGFSSRSSWLAADISPDFSAAAQMAIDGSIWVLTTGGEIFKFTRGAIEAFALAGLDKPLSGPRAIYTNEDSEKLYILDWGNTRVVVLGKSGEYDSQYVWAGIASVTDLVVDETQGKILLLAGEKIYEIGLQE